jgi:hypothetical protein
LGQLDGRFREWLQQHGERVMRPRQTITATFPVADQEYRFRHQLPRVPTAWVVTDRDKAGIVYRSKTADAHYVYLKSDTADLTVEVEIS